MRRDELLTDGITTATGCTAAAVAAGVDADADGAGGGGGAISSILTTGKLDDELESMMEAERDPFCRLACT